VNVSVINYFLFPSNRQQSELCFIVYGLLQLGTVIIPSYKKQDTWGLLLWGFSHVFSLTRVYMFIVNVGFYLGFMSIFSWLLVVSDSAWFTGDNDRL